MVTRFKLAGMEFILMMRHPHSYSKRGKDIPVTGQGGP
jgi:hypothetical protein